MPGEQIPVALLVVGALKQVGARYVVGGSLAALRSIDLSVNYPKGRTAEARVALPFRLENPA